MANGYTHPVKDGTVTDPREFLMSVGRGLGFAIMQRDEPLSVPVKEVAEPGPDSYHVKGLAEAVLRQRQLKRMPLETAQTEAQREAENVQARNEKWLKDLEIERQRFDVMLAHVENWTPPESLPEAKEVALKWLKESIEHDCSDQMIEEKRAEVDARQMPLTPEAWLEKEHKRNADDLEYHTEKLDKEIELAKERNRIIRDFLDSLPDTPEEA